MNANLISRLFPLFAVLMVACAPEVPPAAKAEDIQRAVDQAERELASAKAAATPITPDLSGT